MKIDILGVKVNQVSFKEASDKVEQWLREKSGKHYVVTPNLEMILLAQKDSEFKKALNEADLGLPDSSRIGWLQALTQEKSLLKRLLLLFVGIVPKFGQVIRFDTVTGTDLMERLCQRSGELGFTTGFLGGEKSIAKETAERLRKKYPKLKVGYADSGGIIDEHGEWVEGVRPAIPPVDLLFVAFGQKKQEKWMSKNLKEVPAKVMMGVGGAFDYLSGRISRAPGWMRSLGLEWLYRLIRQPWRLKRQLEIVRFILSLIF